MIRKNPDIVALTIITLMGLALECLPGARVTSAPDAVTLLSYRTAPATDCPIQASVKRLFGR